MEALGEKEHSAALSLMDEMCLFGQRQLRRLSLLAYKHKYGLTAGEFYELHQLVNKLAERRILETVGAEPGLEVQFSEPEMARAFLAYKARHGTKKG